MCHGPYKWNNDYPISYSLICADMNRATRLHNKQSSPMGSIHDKPMGSSVVWVDLGVHMHRWGELVRVDRLMVWVGL
jgi:hypothetical protein